MTEMDWETGADGDTKVTEMDWTTGADGDTGVTEMDRATGSIYSGDPGVDSPTSHLISQLVPSYHKMNCTLYLCQLLITLVLPGICRSTNLRGFLGPGSIISSHPLATLLEPELLILTNPL